MILTLWLILWAFTSSAQVYNFTPFSHFDRETNPSVLASRSQDGLFATTHRQNLFNAGNYSQTNLTYSKYLSSAFSGVGLTVNSTRLNDTVAYKYAGIGGAYRTVLFNKIYVKVGAMYKYVDLDSKPGLMGFYEIAPYRDYWSERTVQNVNLAFSISSPEDHYHLSFSMLNQPVPWTEEPEFETFAQYYVLNIGDFYTLFTQSRSASIKAAAFFNTSTINGSSPWSFYLHGHTILMRLTRKSTLYFGGRYGYADNEFFHFTPSVSYFRDSESAIFRRTRNGSMTIRFSYDMGFHHKTWHTTFKPVAQLSLIIQPT